jgi:Flp pilus assembly protein TadD
MAPLDQVDLYSPRLSEAADVLAAGGDYAEAIEVYERALRLGMVTPRLHHNLGSALYEMGRPRGLRGTSQPPNPPAT